MTLYKVIIISAFFMSEFTEGGIKMVNMANKDAKLILASKRANMYYLEHVKVSQKDGRVVYLAKGKERDFFYNIPFANTTVVILGEGTSITNGAVRLLASAGVSIGFTGSDGTPLYACNEIEWINSANEYRPTEYMHAWCKMWYDDAKRLEAAKKLQEFRLGNIKKIWDKDRELQEQGFFSDDMIYEQNSLMFSSRINNATDISQLLLAEAEFTKRLYVYACRCTGKEWQGRDRKSGDYINMNLTRGNYYAYGLAASVLWTLGISYGYAVMHGKTRKGGLVFDVADLIKDALVLPYAFIYSEEEFKQHIKDKFFEHQVLDLMYSQVKDISGLGDNVCL